MKNKQQIIYELFKAIIMTEEWNTNLYALNVEEKKIGMKPPFVKDVALMKEKI